MHKKILILLIITLALTGCNDSKRKEEDFSNHKLGEITEPTTEQPVTNRNPEVNSNNNNDSSNKIDDNDDNNTETPTNPTCVSKKFEKDYTYAYSTRDECIANGSRDTAEVSETIDENVISYGCEAIKDECGTTWYGVYFNSKDPITDETIRKNY